ncbi:MAG TPA: FtsQ-type POTRA domain-containing protein [Edaphobacter sp.]
MLEAPEPEYVPKVTASQRKPAAPDRTMRRDFSDFDDDFDDLPQPRRRQAGVKVRLKGGLPKSWGGRLGIVAAVLVLVGLCAGAVMVAKAAILHDDRFVIPSSSYVEVQGNSHVTRAQLLSIFGEDVERNIFRVSLDERKAELEQLPWVEHATVMRLLPNRLRVAVVERTPVAFVRQGNHIGLVDGNGVLLDMPTDVQADMQYSFPVVIGLKPSDPLSLRAARMKLYARFTGDLDSGGEKISQKLSEVDLSDPEDVRAIVEDKAGEVMVHFGEDNFLDRYKKFEEHLGEWRTQYPHLSSVDMRYDRQVVLEMQRGTTPPLGGGEATTDATANPASSDAAKAGATAAKPAAAAAKPTVAGKPAPEHPAAKPTGHAAPAKKPVAKSAAKPKAAVKTTTTTARPVASSETQQRPASANGESFWVHPKKGLTKADASSGTELKPHPPEVVHR